MTTLESLHIVEPTKAYLETLGILRVGSTKVH